MSIQSHTERPKLDEMFAELYDQYVSGRMNEDDLIESLSKFLQNFLERGIFKRLSNLFFIKSQIKDTWQRVKEIWKNDEYKKFHCFMIRVLNLVSASHQAGQSSPNESHSTKPIPENRGMQEEIVSVSHQNGNSSQNEIHSTDRITENRGMQEEMMDSLVDESKISYTDYLKDKSKEEHKTKSNNSMSSNGLFRSDIQLLKSSGSQSPIVNYQEYELSDRQNMRTNDKLSKDLSSALTKYRVEKSFIESYSRKMSALTKKNAHKSNKSNTKRASNKNPGNGAESHIKIDTLSERDNSILQKQDLPKEIKKYYKDNSDGTGDTLSNGLSVGKGNSIHACCTIISSSPLESDHNDRIKTSVFSIYFQLISLMFNYLLASTLDYLDERTYSQTDLVLYEVNPRGRRKYLLFTRFWMVTRDLFSNAIALTAHISNIYYTGIYPTDCRMNLYLPCLIGHYLHEKDEIDDRLPGRLNTQEPINGRSSYLTDCTNPRINM